MEPKNKAIPSKHQKFNKKGHKMNDTPDMPPAKRVKIESDAQNTQDSKSYGLHVTPEEVENLREFQVLDEVNDEEESNKEESEQSGSSADELPEEEIEKMLEEDLPEGFRGAPKQKERKYVRRKKVILEEKGTNYFEVLPLDWMAVRHCSGMPIYVHRPTRVCTLSKPYFLGKGNTRKHEIPISAIPCLAYSIALKEEQKQMEIDKQIAEQIKNGTWADPKPAENKATENGDTKVPTDVVEIADDTQKDDGQTLSSSDVICQKLENKAEDSEKPKCPFKFNLSTLKENAESSPSSNDSSRFPARNENSQNVESIVTESPGDETSQNVDSSAVSAGAGAGEAAGAGGGEAAGVGGAGGSASGSGWAPRPVVLPGGLMMPPPRVESVHTSWKAQQLNATQLNDYCKKLFIFKEVYILHFKRWADRRKYTKARKTMQYPTLPEGTKLITIPAQETGNKNGGIGAASGKMAKRDWVMNMNGCSYLSVFHEYVRRALHKQPVYEFKQLENASQPYQATVYIGGMQYGVGHGSSKRIAKSHAARASIHILIPEMRDDQPGSLDPASRLRLELANTERDPDFTFFDYVSIEDPRIQEFCGAAAEPSPHAILRTCLLRNFGAGDRNIQTEMKKLEFQKIELTMKVGKHTATVVCKNKKQAKQRASQSILQQLHPHITSWGSLLRLYGSRSMKSCKEKKQEEQQITLLQDKARHNEPNHAVLEKLRKEMGKLKNRDNAVVPIGTLLLCEDLPTHSGSNLNNVDL